MLEYAVGSVLRTRKANWCGRNKKKEKKKKKREKDKKKKRKEIGGAKWSCRGQYQLPLSCWVRVTTNQIRS